jgi:hypothetical protein
VLANLLIILLMLSMSPEVRIDATPDDGIDDHAAVQAAIDRAPKDAVIAFGDGVYDFDRTLLFRSNRTYRGSGRTILRFKLPPETYGIALEANAFNINIENLRLEGGGIRLTDGAKYTDIRITGNDISALPRDTRGVYATIENVGLVVERNMFRDFAEWGAIIYHVDRGSFSHNTFTNITQGAQIVNPYDDVKVSFNRGTGLHRMGLEIQQFTADGRPCKRLVVEGNVFLDWREPYWDSFGLSVMPQNGQDVRIVNNYLLASHEGPMGEPDSSGVKRWGYGIEAGFRSGAVEGNIVAGNWANHIVVSMPNTPVRNNRLFGRPSWKKYVTGEPGLKGTGSAIEQDNSIEPNMKRVPKPPAPSSR